MAWSAADVPAADVTRANNDKPIIVFDHIIANTTLTDARWNSDGNFATADNVNSSFPIRYSYDRRIDTPTKRTTGATTSWLIFDAGASGFPDFDVCAILGHNFADITVTQIDLGISDAADVAGGAGAEIIETWSTAGDWANNKRLVSRDLRSSGATTNERFSDVRYLGLKITSSGSETPEVGELWLGKRMQMHTRELVPTTAESFGVDYGEFVSENRHRVRAVLAQGFASYRAEFRFKDSTLEGEIRTGLADAQYGARPFLYLHEPNTDVQNAVVGWATNTPLAMENEGNSVQKLTIDLDELAPFYTSES